MAIASNEGKRQHQLREGQEDIGDAHQDRVGPAAGITGDRADQEADGRGDDGDQDHHVKRPARAIDDARIDVAAEVVGAEPVRGARRQQAGVLQIADGGRIGRQHVGKGGDHKQRDDDQHADQRQPIGREAPPGDIGTAEPCLQA
jgi:hypothetical protein